MSLSSSPLAAPALPSWLAAPSAESSSARSSGTPAADMCSSKLGRLSRSSKQHPSFGCSIPNPTSPNPLTSHVSASATDRLLVSEDQNFGPRVPTALGHSPHFPRYLPHESSLGSISGIYSFHPSSDIPRGGSTTLHPFAASHSPRRGGSIFPRDNSLDNPPSHSNRSALFPGISKGLDSQASKRPQLNCSDPITSVPIPISPMPSQSSTRNTAGGSINKSIQNLLRRCKTTETRFDGSAPPSPLHIASKSVNEPRMHKSNSTQSLLQSDSSTILSSESYRSSYSSRSARSFQLFPRSPLTHCSSAHGKHPMQNGKYSEGSLKSVPSFYSTTDSDTSYSPLPTPTLPNPVTGFPGKTSDLPQTAIITGSLSVGNPSNFPGNGASVKISFDNPAELETPALVVTEESDGNDSEMEDIVANLRNIAAPKMLRDQSWENSSNCSPETASIASSIHSDRYSVDYDDTRSEYSFDAAVDVEEDPDLFPLPSWPTLGSTSQSPLGK